MSHVPDTYDEWKHCITVKCGIPLTQSYVQERLTALNDQKDYHTQRFVERWGADHHARTIAWFEQAAQEFAA
ncbi:MAG: hypothetical protein AAF718_11235 [Pseudomonadota bacterium]